MRKIKFRGKRLDGRWIYGDLWHRPYTKDWVTIVSFMDDTGGFVVIPETVGQYTGIKDKNGNEIYEDDILKTWIGGYEQASPYVVKDMRKLYFELKRDDSYYRIQKTEIIGNIYENKELIEVECN